MENLPKKLEWNALEYEEKERGQDWFWALGVVVASGSIASILFENYFFAALLIIGGGLLGFLSVKKPDSIKYEINESGVKIQNELYPFKNIKVFWIQLQNPETGEKDPTLFIKTERIYMPTISIPIKEEDAEAIRALMLEKEIGEEEMREHFSMKILDRLGF